MHKSLFILVCASVRTCDDPHVGPIIQFHEDAALGSSVSSLFDKKFHRIYNVYSYLITLIACAFWLNLEMKLMHAHLKHS